MIDEDGPDLLSMMGIVVGPDDNHEFLVRELGEPFDERRNTFHREVLYQSTALSSARSLEAVEQMHADLRLGLDSDSLSENEDVALAVLQWVLDEDLDWPLDDLEVE